jgi:hypothetical protein
MRAASQADEVTSDSESVGQNDDISIELAPQIARSMQSKQADSGKLENLVFNIA